MNGLALRLRMIVLQSIVAEGKKEMRVGNGSPTVMVCMIATSSRKVVAQKKHHQHPFTCFYQRLSHLPVLQFDAKVNIIFVFGKLLLHTIFYFSLYALGDIPVFRLKYFPKND
jgi:hypothetical protein